MGEDEWEYRKVRKPPNTHFGKSTQTPGVEREILYEDGTNKLKGPPESLPVDEEELRERFSPAQPPLPSPSKEQERTPLQQELAEMGVEFLEQFINEVAVPYAKNKALPYVKNTALPAVRSKCQELADLRRVKKEIERPDPPKSIGEALPKTKFIRYESKPTPAPGEPTQPLFSFRRSEDK